MALKKTALAQPIHTPAPFVNPTAQSLRLQNERNRHMKNQTLGEARMKAFIAIAMLAAAAPVAAEDYAAWAKKNADGSWTAAAEVAVASSGLPSAVPSDVEKFCPVYKDLDSSNRKVFWVGLLSIIARPESNFKPETKYTESFKDSHGKQVISRGLLQISIESANQKRYACGIKRAEDLHDPATNLACGVKILDAWVKKDKVIATYGSGPSRGGGRYWSTLRERNKHLPELTTFTRALKVCSAA